MLAKVTSAASTFVDSPNLATPPTAAPADEAADLIAKSAVDAAATALRRRLVSKFSSYDDDDWAGVKRSVDSILRATLVETAAPVRDRVGSCNRLAASFGRVATE